jgi:hypothetical protein
VISLRSLVTSVHGIARLLLFPAPPNRRGGSYAVTVVTPIEPGQVEALRTVLRGFEPGEGSPLHELADVQFARWVVIDQLLTDWAGAPRRPSRLVSQYLLFSADLTAPPDRVDGLPEAFFRELATVIPTTCAEVWGKCRGFPGLSDVEAFVGYLKRSQIEFRLYYARFPDATPGEISKALEVRRRLAEFVVDHQADMSLAPGSPGVKAARQRLRDDYRRQFP